MKVDGKCWFLKIIPFRSLCAKFSIMQFENLRCISSQLECMEQKYVELLHLYFC